MPHSIQPQVVREMLRFQAGSIYTIVFSYSWFNIWLINTSQKKNTARGRIIFFFVAQHSTAHGNKIEP